MLCHTCYFVFVISSSLALNLENISLNRSLYNNNELWDELMQNCGQRSAFSCVQSNIYGYLEKSLDSDFYVTDSFFFKKNKNRYSEEMNTVDDGTSVSLRESRSRWNKLEKSFPSNPRTGERRLSLDGKQFSEMEENKVSSEISEEFQVIKKKENEEAESFSEFVKAVEDAENSYKEEHTTDSSSFIGRTEIPSTTQTQTETETQTPESETKSEAPSSPLQPPKSISDITDILYHRGISYLMTHDIEMHLPHFIFGGAKIVISPRAIEKDGGALFKFFIQPQATDADRSIHFKKLFHKKLMSSMLAAMMIIKLIKVKLMFLLPVLLGVGTAKKILLKVLLFIFPALAHLFKLCSYYHHHAKYHHHHHQVAHHHHHIPVPVHVPHHHHGDYGPPGYEASGPGEYIHSRTDIPGTISQHGSELASWGLGDFPPGWEDPRVSRSAVPVTEPTKTINYPHRPQPGGFQYPDNEIKAPPYPHRSGPQSGPSGAGPSSAGVNGIVSGPGPAGSHTRSPPAGYIKSNYNQALTSRLQALTPRPPLHDPFYSPILNRIDIVFASLGVHDEGCRERLVCSMYKNPTRFTPHSNLLSAELSKEPGELQKPSSMNQAVMRFFKYMQAARDGQDFKDCLRIYAACSINTER
ncbi:DUF1676 domain-containing protein Osi17 [Lycorma delicatula]|uniref:DUF1676 domain-containing protein Osi17 n=1 Tax=Lycorma delicatula TaxID=130591 RepID=UPI003F5132F0